MIDQSEGKEEDAEQLESESINLSEKTKVGLKRMVKEGRFVAEHFHQYCEAMLTRGWMPDTNLPLTVAASLVRIIVDESEQETSKAIEYVMLRLYDASKLKEALLPRLMDAKCLEGRTGIVEKAIISHCQGHFELSVPVLCAQIEGVIIGSKIDGKKAKNRLSEVLAEWRELQVRKPLEDARVPDDKIDELIEEQKKPPDYARIADLQANAVDRLVGKQLYGNFRQEVPLNRNRILHGIEVDYAKEPISLRAILLLRFIVSCVEDLNQQDDTEQEKRSS